MRCNRVDVVILQLQKFELYLAIVILYQLDLYVPLNGSVMNSMMI